MSILLSILIACGGDATETTEVAETTTTDNNTEVVETTTTDEATTDNVTTETTTGVTTENTVNTTENTETTTTPDEQFRRVRGSLQKPLSFMEDK